MTLVKDGRFFKDEAMFNKVRVSLGKGYLDKYIVYENKRLFSVYFHIFNTIEQDRFHTHAFDGHALLLKGGYDEEVMLEDGCVVKQRIHPGYRFIPMSHNHRLLKSKPNTISVLFTGPWSEFWTETNDMFVRTLAWGRKEISRLTRN